MEDLQKGTVSSETGFKRGLVTLSGILKNGNMPSGSWGEKRRKKGLSEGDKGRR